MEPVNHVMLFIAAVYSCKSIEYYCSVFNRVLLVFPAPASLTPLATGPVSSSELDMPPDVLPPPPPPSSSLPLEEDKVG